MGSEALTIQAAVLREKGGPLRIEPLQMDGPRDDEILVRLVASGICRTDIDYCDSWHDGEEAQVLGHEGAGVVERIGREVKGVGRGDHVVLSFQSCGACPACSRGRPTSCERFWKANFGFARLDGSNALERSGVRGHFFGQSSFASHALATARNLVRVERGLPLELLAPLGCGLQTGAGTVLNSLAVPAGASIAIFGTGTVGLAAVMAARIAGAGPIIGIDIVPDRLDMALELGADHAIDNSHEDLTGRITALTGGVDFVVETTGSPQMKHLAIAVLNPGGTVALLTGESGSDSLPQGRRTLGIIQGDAVPQRFIPKLIALHRTGRFPFESLVRFYDFSDINQAMDEVRSGKTVKAVLRMR